MMNVIPVLSPNEIPASLRLRHKMVHNSVDIDNANYATRKTVFSFKLCVRRCVCSGVHRCLADVATHFYHD